MYHCRIVNGDKVLRGLHVRLLYFLKASVDFIYCLLHSVLTYIGDSFHTFLCPPSVFLGYAIIHR